jgi:hypothetical protein
MRARGCSAGVEQFLTHLGVHRKVSVQSAGSRPVAAEAAPTGGPSAATRRRAS